ncbi:MAG: transposase [Planctomycetes bacterium]|nr:transposase [Planctomycetota bacterium]
MAAKVRADGAQLLEAYRCCAENVPAVRMDFHSSHQAAMDQHLPWTDLAFEKLNVIQTGETIVVEVCRREVRSTSSLKRSHCLWLKDVHERTRRHFLQYFGVNCLNLKTHRAFRITEEFRGISRAAPDRETAEAPVKHWYQSAGRCRLERIKPVAKTLKDHWEGILNAFDSRLANGRVETVNALIQTAKDKVRGYGTTRHLNTIAYSSPVSLRTCQPHHSHPSELKGFHLDQTVKDTCPHQTRES